MLVCDTVWRRSAGLCFRLPFRCSLRLDVFDNPAGRLATTVVGPVARISEPRPSERETGRGGGRNLKIYRFIAVFPNVTLPFFATAPASATAGAATAAACAAAIRADPFVKDGGDGHGSDDGGVDSDRRRLGGQGIPGVRHKVSWGDKVRLVELAGMV